VVVWPLTDIPSCDVLRCQLKDLPTLKKTKSVRGALKKPNKPKSMVPFQLVLFPRAVATFLAGGDGSTRRVQDKHRQKWNERFEAYIKQASQAAILRTMLAPRVHSRSLSAVSCACVR
jgi:hypothetical protein